MDEETIERTAACACGQLEIHVRGEPLRVGMCHCLQCQRRTGSLFGASAFFGLDQVIGTSGEARTYARTGDSGGVVTFHFCSTCGSSVYWTRDQRPGLMTIAAGAFADPHFPPPVAAYWTQHRHAWLDLPEDMPSYPQNP